MRNTIIAFLRHPVRLLTVTICAALFVGGGSCPVDDKCDVTDREREDYAACRAAEDQATCVDLDGRWVPTQIGIAVCACTSPDEGCVCRTSSDCPLSTCVVESGACVESAENGICVTETNCRCVLSDDGTAGVFCVDG